MKGFFAKKPSNNNSTTSNNNNSLRTRNQSFDDSNDEDSYPPPSSSSTSNNNNNNANYPNVNDNNDSNNNNGSNPASDQRQQKGAVMSMFKKGLTAGKHKLLQSVGKADKIEHSEDYNVHNNLYKDNVIHYKAVDRLGKRMIKSCEQVANDEQALGESLIKQSEVLQTHQRFNRQVASEGLESLTLLMQSVGQAFNMLGSLRENLQTNISVDYLQQVHECIEEANVCKEVKDNFRECLMEQNVEFNKLKTLKDKSTDLVKIKNQEIVHEKRVKISETVESMAMKEFDYQELILKREYARSIQELVNAYRNYFLSGAEVLNSLEQELLATTLPPVQETSQRAYSLRELDQVMSKQNNNDNGKPVASRAEVLEKRRVFGVELAVVNKREHSYIPRIAIELIQYVEQQALQVEGIFRMAAGVAGLNTLKKYYDGGKPVDLEKLIATKEIDIHCVSCLLKLYLRELPSPLLTFELYEQFLAACAQEDENDQMRELASLLQQLPHHNMLLLDRVLRMLTKVAGQSQVNLMTTSNLAIVFGLNLLKSTDGNPLRIAKDNAAVNKVCDCLIKSYSGKLSGTFATLAAIAKQERDREIKQEMDEERAHPTEEQPEYRNTAPKVISPEHYLPPPPKNVVDNASRRLPVQPSVAPYQPQPQPQQAPPQQPQQLQQYQTAQPPRPNLPSRPVQPPSPRSQPAMIIPPRAHQVQPQTTQPPPATQNNQQQQIYPTMHQDYYDYEYEEQQSFNPYSSPSSPDEFFWD